MVLADRGYDTHAVRDVIDLHGGTYIIPKRKYVDEWEAIEKVKAHPTADIGVNNEASLTVDGLTHDVSSIYVPSRLEDGKYIVFTVNQVVDPERAEGLVAQYRRRWLIEIEYKVIKDEFLPTTCSTDYRVRFAYMVSGILLYNTWRLTNLLLRDEVTVDLGDNPPISSGEFVEIVAVCLEPG